MFATLLKINMQFRLVSLIACVGSLLMALPKQAVYSQVAPPTDEPIPNLLEQKSKQLSPSQLSEKARSITVKVLAGRAWGSGILIQKQGQLYTVLTNAHVLRLGDSYRIETPEGEIYSGTPVFSKGNTLFNGNDLALLQFRSANNYNIATLGNSANLTLGAETFAAGFPADGNQSQDKGFVFTTGKVSFLLPQPFLDGYQVGYTNDIFKGMSGGPVLNYYGEVIAINGRHKYPLWGNNYIFKDGSTPVLQVRKQMDESSWAIPIQTFVQLAPQFARASVTSSSVRQLAPIVPEENNIRVEPISNNRNITNPKNRTRSFW